MKPVIIIGSGHAGLSMARELRTRAPELPIRLISREPIHAYYKPSLSKALSMAKEPQDLVTKTVGELETELNVQMDSQTQVQTIEPQNQSLRLKQVSGNIETLFYQNLVLATGASPFLPPIKRDPTIPFFTVNSLEEYRVFRTALQPGLHVLIIGAGFVGTELASDLCSSGHTVSVVDKCHWPLQRVIPDTLGTAIRQSMAAEGVDWHFGQSIESLFLVGNKPHAHLSNGAQLPCDLVVSAAGLIPNTELARHAGLEVETGIIVSAYGETSSTGIYALGDCAQYEWGTLPFISPITQAAKAMAMTLTGNPSRVNLPTLAVPVKIPACPTVVSPPLQSKGMWEVQGSAQDLEAHFISPHGKLLGFALTGSAVARRSSLLARCLHERGAPGGVSNAPTHAA